MAKDKFSLFDSNATADTGDFLVGYDPNTGAEMKVLWENLGVNSGNITFKASKGVFAGTATNDAAYIGSYDVDGSVNVAHIGLISAATPYGYTTSTMLQQIGGSASLGYPTAWINGSTTPVGTVGAGEDDGISLTVPASVLATTSRGVAFRFQGYTANNANAKVCALRIGAVFITNASKTLTISIADEWIIEGLLMRTGSNTQVVQGRVSAIGVHDRPFTQELTLTETSSIIIKSTMQGVADNDVVTRSGFLGAF